MKNILVPTDFSNTATSALDYAAQLCKELQTELVLLHVMHIPAIDSSVAINALEIVMESQKEAADKKLTDISNELISNYGIRVKTKSKFGLAAAVIAAESEELESYLVIMGTNGSSNILDRLLGSVSNAVVKKCSIPVIVLPENTTYSTIDNVVFAYDYKEDIKKELEFVSLLEPNNKKVKIDVISIETDKEKTQYREEIVLEEDNMKEICIWSESVLNGITKYISGKEVDLVVLKRHDRSFLENLFYKSTSKELLNNGTLPLLVF